MGASWRAGERRKCSACGVECIGAKSRHGSVGPIELAPNRHGNVMLFKDEKGDLRYAVVPPQRGGAKAEENAAVRRWIQENFVTLRMNHFATCPERERFARERKDDEQDGTKDD